MNAIIFIVGLLLAAFPGGTAVEYFVHRTSHGWLRKSPWGRYHATHHADTRTALYHEIMVYQPFAILMSLMMIPVGYLFSWWLLFGWATGAFGYATTLGVYHHCCHVRELVDHERHHNKRGKWVNFGVLSSFWDKVCGTYKRESV